MENLLVLSLGMVIQEIGPELCFGASVHYEHYTRECIWYKLRDEGDVRKIYCP